MQIIGSRVTVYGSLLFKDNSNSMASIQDNGALYITSQGQLQFTAHSSLTFVNNSGMYVAMQHSIEYAIETSNYHLNKT